MMNPLFFKLYTNANDTEIVVKLLTHRSLFFLIKTHRSHSISLISSSSYGIYAEIFSLYIYIGIAEWMKKM